MLNSSLKSKMWTSTACGLNPTSVMGFGNTLRSTCRCLIFTIPSTPKPFHQTICKSALRSALRFNGGISFDISALASSGLLAYLTLMQTSKSFLVLCVAVIASIPVALRADDTEAQIKARQALEKTMQDMPSQPSNAAPAKASARPARPAPVQPPVVTPAPAPQTAPVTPPVTTAAPPADSASVIDARQRLQQKLNQLESQPAPAPAVQPAPAVIPPPVVTPPPVTTPAAIP